MQPQLFFSFTSAGGSGIRVMLVVSVIGRMDVREGMRGLCCTVGVSLYPPCSFVGDLMLVLIGVRGEGLVGLGRGH